MKIKYTIYTAVFAGLLLPLLFSCQKEATTAKVVPTFTIAEVTDITTASAICGGNITTEGGSAITARGVCWTNALRNPNILDPKTLDGIGTGSFTSTILGLTSGITYFIRAYVVNDDGVTYGPVTSFTTSTTGVAFPTLTYGTVTDVDGNVYKTITIGTQTWMAENLRTTKYRNGTAIPNVTDSLSWIKDTTGIYCNYKNNADNLAIYGALYNSYAVNNSNNIAPVGWHVPTDNEWTTLTNFLGGETVAGGKLKEINLTHWIDINTSAANTYGFSAIASGERTQTAKFDALGYECIWWSSTLDPALLADGTPSNAAYYRYITYNAAAVVRGSSFRNMGFSVRCVKD